MRAQFAKRERGRGVAGDHHEIGIAVRDGAPGDVDDALDQPVLFEISVRETGIIGDVDEICIRPRRPHLLENRQAAETGVEQ